MQCDEMLPAASRHHFNRGGGSVRSTIHSWPHFSHL